VVGERVNEDRRKRDGALAFLALRLDDAEDVFDEAHVAPAKRPELEAPYPGEHEHQEHRPRRARALLAH
jgi:hypothetical protein